MNNRAPRILYLSFYFPPSRASGVYRARATANLLAQRGWDVTVLTAPLDFLYDAIGSVDELLLETVDARIRVERPNFGLYRWQTDIRQFSPLRRNMPRLATWIHEFGQRRFFPERYESWARAAVKRALRLHAGRRFDVVLATGNPFASFGAAWAFSRMTGVPYLLDNRDAWTLDLFKEAPAFPEDHPAWKWERRVLGRAGGLSFVNEALRQWHAERYPALADRMMVVPNGWDPDLLTQLGSDDSRSDRPEGPLVFSYLGTVTGVQPLEQMVAAFGQARQDPSIPDAELHLHGHLGFFAGSGQALSGRLGLDGVTAGGLSPDGVRYMGPVSKKDVGEVYENSDVLVFLAGGARYMTSGKIFEYMAAGRPIVSVHAPGIAAQEVLEGYPLWFNANSLEPSDLAQAMVAAGKAARDLTGEQRKRAREHAERYARDATLQPLLDRLGTLAGRNADQVVQSR